MLSPRAYSDGDEDTPITPPHMQGPMTRARARQFNNQVLSLLRAVPNVNENMMLPKSNVFVSLRNDGPSTDERDKLWSMYIDGDGSNHTSIGDDATRGDFRTLKPP